MIKRAEDLKGTTTMLTRVALDQKIRDEIASLLQETLGELIDFSLQLKQGHWNCVGRHFRDVHLQLDEILASTREHADEVAERIAALGIASEGNAGTTAKASKLEPFPSGLMDADAVSHALAERFGALLKHARERQARLGELDAVSEDVMIAMLRDLEKHAWMLNARTADKS